MWSENNFQQLSFDDILLNMPKYLKEILTDSWADDFQKVIFPAIDEKRFSVLYSDKPSRPNSPVNVIIGALILKEIFQLSDKELLGAIYFDDRFQYALRLTSQEKPPISINTFVNFRKRVYEFEQETGRDLIKEEVESISSLIAKRLEIDNKKVRVDSFMVASSCRNLSRLELIYTVNKQLVKKIKQEDKEIIPPEFNQYLKDGHKKDTIYSAHDNKAESKLEFLLKHSKTLYDLILENSSLDIYNSQEFKNLKRLLDEQTKNNDNDEDDDNNYIPKENNEIKPDSLQSPFDPDATYRFKYGDNIGYTGNVVEVFDGKNSIIKHYDLKPNTYSDQKFSRDTIKTLAKKTDKKEPLKMLIDGTYFSIELAKEAIAEGIKLIPGELTGRKPDENKLNYSNNFTVNDKNIITGCTEGHQPFYSDYDEENEVFTAKFAKKDCKNCNLKEKCRINFQKKANTVRFTKRQYEIAKARKKMDTEQYQELTNQRAGIEGLPSVFRRKYNVDNMPVMGLVRSKLYFSFKVLASNVKKLFKRPKVVTE